MQKIKICQKLQDQINNKSPQYNQQEEPEQCKSEVEDIYLQKPGKWTFLSENIDDVQQIILMKELYLKVVKLRSNIKN